jgi:hypothetical protein
MMTKKNYKIIFFFFLLASTIFENSIKTKIISHENKFYISLTDEQNLKLKEILTNESLNNLKLNIINENTYLIEDADFKFSSFYEIKEKKSLEDFEHTIKFKSCNY